MRFVGPDVATDLLRHRDVGRVADPRRRRRRQAHDARRTRASSSTSRARGFQGQSSDIEIHAREILTLRRRTEEIYARHTGQEIERLHDDMERDRSSAPTRRSSTGSSTAWSKTASCRGGWPGSRPAATATERRAGARRRPARAAAGSAASAPSARRGAGEDLGLAGAGGVDADAGAHRRSRG